MTATAQRRIVDNVIRLDTAGGSASQPYDISRVDDVLARNIPPKTPDLIEHIIPADARSVEILAHDGDGKTQAALHILLAGAIGRPACQRFRVARPLRTLFLEDDTPAAVMRRREAAILDAMRLSPAEEALVRSNWLPIRDQGFVFREPARLEATLAALAAEHRPVDIVAIDSRTTATPDHPDDPVVARQIFTTVIKPIADRFGVVFMVLSHPPKARTDQKGNRARLTIAGTGVLQRHCDVIIGLWLESRKPDAVSFTWLKVRDGEPPPTTLFLADLDPEGWGWCALRPSDDHTLIDGSAITSAKAELRTYIAGAPQRMRQACIDHIKAALGLELRTTAEALGQLVQEKAVDRHRIGREVAFSIASADLCTTPSDPSEVLTHA